MFPTLPTLASSLSRAIQLTTPAHSAPFKRSQNGLFHGKMKIYGNSVPFSKKKTRRFWLPNLQNKTFRSEALDKDVEVKVSTKALKTIRKYGGIDPYLLQTPSSLLGYEGIRLRIAVHTATQTNLDITARIARLGTDDPKILLADVQKDADKIWKNWDWRVGNSDGCEEVEEGEEEERRERRKREKERRDRAMWEGNRLHNEEEALERRAGIDPNAWIREQEKEGYIMA